MAPSFPPATSKATERRPASAASPTAASSRARPTPRPRQPGAIANDITYSPCGGSGGTRRSSTGPRHSKRMPTRTPAALSITTPVLARSPAQSAPGNRISCPMTRPWSSATRLRWKLKPDPSAVNAAVAIRWAAGRSPTTSMRPPGVSRINAAAASASSRRAGRRISSVTGRGRCPRQRLLQNVPGEDGALDTDRVLDHAPQCHEVAEDILFWLDLPFHHAAELLGQRRRLRHALSVHRLGEHGRAGLADRASLALERDLLDSTVRQVRADGDLVPAERVVLLAGNLGPRQPTLVPGGLVVVEDDFLVQLIESQRTPPPCRALRSALLRPPGCCTRSRRPGWSPGHPA